MNCLYQYFFPALLFTLLFSGCAQSGKESEENVPAEKTNGEERYFPPLLQELLSQHGGYDTWQQYKKLEYNLVGPKGTREHQLFNLQNRKTLIKKDAAFTIGYDGNDVWVMPQIEAMPRARFYYNLHVYFFGLPFFIADPGAQYENLGTITFNGNNYERLKVTYQSGVGNSPDDQYILYLDADSKQLSFINYSVTFSDPTKAEQYNALVYENWQEVNGLLVPGAYTGYVWENDTLGRQRYHQEFENIRFSETPPSDSLFSRPEKAAIAGE